MASRAPGVFDGGASGEGCGYFPKGKLLRGLRQHETFDPHLCRFIVEIYEKRISHLAEKIKGNPERNQEEFIHENGVSAEAPNPEPDPEASDDVPETEDLGAEQEAESAFPIEDVSESLPAEESLPPDEFEIAEPQSEDHLQEENTAEPETPLAIENPGSLEQNPEVVQNPEEDGWWRSSSLVANKKSKKAKKKSSQPW
jgi:hypothetical protein